MPAIAEILASEPQLLTSLCFLLGLMVGSFLNVVIYRLPVMLERSWQSEARQMLELDNPEQETFNLATPASRCGHCGAAIRAWQNIPVFSYFLLGGKCANCGTQISLRYPVVEFITGILSAVVAWQLAGDPLLVLAALLLTWSLVALTGIDYDTYLLPDNITLPLLWAGLLVNVNGLFVSLPDAVLGAAGGYLVLWSVFWLFKLATGKEGMGYGDFKLLAALGAWLGWQMLPVIIVLSSLVGAAVGIALVLTRRQDASKPIPFGPYLAAAGWIALVWGPAINESYLNASGLG